MYTVSQKNIHDVFDCNLKTTYQILIIFGKIFLIQRAIKRLFSFSPQLTFVSVLPGEKQQPKYHLFIKCDMIAQLT